MAGGCVGVEPGGTNTTEEVRAPASSTSTSLTATTGTTLPFEIADATDPRPVSQELVTSADWTELDRGPLSARWPGVVAWTGEEIVIWGGEPRGGGAALAGGAAYRPETGSWRMMSEDPLGAVSEPGWVWTGTELIIWSHEIAAAWDPETDSWREIGIWPLSPWFYRRAVWTGEEIIDVASGQAVSPSTGASQPIAEPPMLSERGSVVWADGYIVSVTSDGAYHLASNTWTTMPESGLTPLATAGTWTGSVVVAVDYEMNAAEYDPVTNTWSGLPTLPLRFWECFPRAHTFKSQPVIEHCAGIGIWNEDAQQWTPVAHPNSTDLHTARLIATDDHLYAWGGGRTGSGKSGSFHRLETQPDDQPHRMSLGISYLDIPEDWTVTTIDGGATIEVGLISADGDYCIILATHGDARSVISGYVKDGGTLSQVIPYVGGEPVSAVEIDQRAPDELHHLIWPTGTSDVIDVGCETEEAAKNIATRIWSPWQ